MAVKQFGGSTRQLVDEDGSGGHVPLVEVQGGGDASATNQTTEIAKLTSIDSKIPASPSTTAKQDTGNTSLASIDTKTPTSSADTVMQSAAGAIGNGTAANVADVTVLGIQIVGITSATITFEVTIDGTNWVAHNFTNAVTAYAASTATADGIYRARVAGFKQVRARISTWVSGTITATGHAIAAGEAGQTPVAVAANIVTTATLQNAATATGNGTAIDVSGMASLLIAISGTFVATAQFEASLDSTNGTDGTWIGILGESVDAAVSPGTLISSTTVTARNYRFVVSGFKMFRARISAYTSGSITVIGRAQANEGPLPQTNVALYGAGNTTSITTANPTDSQSTSLLALNVNAQADAYNGATWDRLRNNTDLTLLASAARTATTNSSDQVNYNGRGLQLVVDVSVAGTGSITPSIQIKDSISGNYKTIWTAAAAITTVTTTAYEIYPSNLTAVGANLTFTEVVALAMGRTWRLAMVHNNANTITYSASGVTIL